MDSALLVTAPTFTLFSISKALNPHFSNNNSPLIARCIQSRLFAQGRVVSPLASLTYSSPLRSLCVASVPKRLHRHLECNASSIASFGTGGGGVFGGDDGSSGGGGGGGGGEGTDGGDSKVKLGAGGADELSALSPDVIILDVGGMTCGGCAASVKRILESQPQVSSASVNLTTETAIVWPISKAKVVPNWQKELGEALARYLTSCGFKSNLRGRNFEQRAKIKATSDMTGLLSILPSKARLVVDGSIIEVPRNSLSVGDQIVVLPGSQVAARSINLNGTLTIEVWRPGGETAMGGIVHLVEEAQSREALVQRLADKLLDALELSRLTMKTVKQNLLWAFAYNIVGIPIAAGMLLPVNGTMLTPSTAGALMGLSSIGVMTNSLLLFKIQIFLKTAANLRTACINLY
ncbi:hypothetical protein CRYUN_Cryun10bG0095200 [Craigia yunnanensis]